MHEAFSSLRSQSCAGTEGLLLAEVFQRETDHPAFHWISLNPWGCSPSRPFQGSALVDAALQRWAKQGLEV